MRNRRPKLLPMPMVVVVLFAPMPTPKASVSLLHNASVATNVNARPLLGFPRRDIFAMLVCLAVCSTFYTRTEHSSQQARPRIAAQGKGIRPIILQLVRGVRCFHHFTDFLLPPSCRHACNSSTGVHCCVHRHSTLTARQEKLVSAHQRFQRAETGPVLAPVLRGRNGEREALLFIPAYCVHLLQPEAKSDDFSIEESWPGVRREQGEVPQRGSRINPRLRLRMYTRLACVLQKFTISFRCSTLFISSSVQICVAVQCNRGQFI